MLRALQVKLRRRLRRGFPLLAGLLLATTSLAQIDITLVDTDPPGERIFNQGQFTLTYTAQGDAATNGLVIDFFRDDGMGQVTVAIADPTMPPPPFMVVLPLKVGMDRVDNDFTAVVRDVVTNNIDLAGPFTVVSDDVGPDPPEIAAPVFPVTTFATNLRVDGTVLNTQAGGPTLPETEGSVIVQRTDNNVVLGGSPITTTSSFSALVDISSFALDTPVSIDIFSVDSAGNFGTTLTVQVTRMMATDPVVTATLDPPDQTITRDPAVTINGTVMGDVSPLTVNIFVDGLLESQLTGLPPGGAFIHTVNLPGEGAHNISIQGTNPGDPPNAGLAMILGVITLDRTPPAAPIILEPDPLLGTLVTNANTFAIEGFSSERDSTTTDTITPEIRLVGPPGIAFNPVSPLPLDPMTGQFMTEADVSALPDGSYIIDVRVVDEAGNSDDTSVTRITFTRDTESPTIERVLVDGQIAPQVNPEVYVGIQSVPIEITFTEPIMTPPDVTVTQDGGATTPTGRSTTTTRTITYVHGVVPGFDGPVQVDVTGGEDRAGNGLMTVLERLFIVDTVPPEVVSVDPADRTTVATGPEAIRVTLRDIPSPTGTFSGVDLEATQVTLFGPLESGGQMLMVTATPFDPFTLDVVPSAPLPADGTYRISVIAEDKVGNRAIQFQSTFLVDSQALVLSDANVDANPPRGACVTDMTIPGGPGAPFVELTVREPQFDPVASTMVVRDFCRVPPEVPGTKSVIGPSTVRFTFADPIATNGTSDGIYAIQLDPVDQAGNVGATFTTTFVVDTLAPSVAATFPESTTAVNGPLRIVDATLLDENRDFCRRAGGIDREATVVSLTLLQPNTRTNMTPPNTQVPGTLRFLSVGDVDKALLEIVDASGFPRGLRTDGGDDGIYQLSVEAFDCATNTSGMVISTFTYDTIRPVLEVEDLMEGDSITGPDFTLTGDLVDDLGGSGVERVTVTLEAVDAGGNVTTSPFLLDAPATLDPTPLGAVQPRADWTFVGDLRRVPMGTNARLRVRGFDRAGNFDEAIFQVTAMEGTLPPPQLSAPATDAATSAQIIPFSWDPVGPAARYRLRIRTPNGDELLRETEGDETTLTVNLNALPDPEGEFLWAVASLDGVGGQGEFSPNRRLTVDRTKPVVLAVDVLDPSPEAAGSINEGLIRLTLRFSEEMDPRVVPNVTVQLENTSIAPLPVQILSYGGDILQGEATIPTAEAIGRDPNGIAAVQVSGAADRAGNTNVIPQGGITLFEVDTGPFWRAATFKNPIDDQDVILVVKGFGRDGGPPDVIVDRPSVIVKRQGQGDQVPVMHRVSQSTFRGSFRLDRRTTRDVTVEVAGRDEDGNTSRRSIALAVNRLSPNEDIRIQASGLRIAAPAGAVSGEVEVLTMAASHALQPELPAGELEWAVALPQFGPLGISLERPVQVSVDPEALPEDLRGLGLYYRTGDAWVFVAPVGEGGASGEISGLAPMALLRDRVAPQVGAPELAWERGRLEVKVPVTDRGAGLDAGRSEILVGGRLVTLRHVGDSLVGEIRGAREGEPVLVAAADRAGNTSSAVQALVPPPTFGFSEAAVFPNPVRVAATLRYRLNQAATSVRADIYDAAGRRVQSLAGPGGAGLQVLSWDLRTRRGRRVANGVYLVDLVARGPGGAARERLKVAVLR